MPELAPSVAGSVADALSPGERLRPSEWAEKHYRIKPGTAEQPGLVDLWPWQPAYMDAVVDHPEKKGAVFIKATQMGVSTAALAVNCWAADQRPGPMLYLMSTDQEAKEFEADRISYAIRNCPRLKQKFFLGRTEGEKTYSKEFAGGRWRIYGGGSTTKLQSHPYWMVTVDELDMMRSIAGEGDPWKMAQSRTESFTRSWILGLGKPTLEKAGISRIWANQTDQRRYHIECPHCGTWQWLKFSQVQYPPGRPEQAHYRCEGCREEITDGQRRRAIPDGEFRTTLEPEEAEKRPFLGFHISRLYDVRKTIAGLAMEWAQCQTESQEQVFFNEVLGEPFTPSEQAVIEEDVQDKAVLEPEELAPEDTRFVTAGVDIQHGEWFYYDISAWTSRGRKLLWDWGTVQGWERLKDVLRSYRVETEDDRELKVSPVCIDSQYQTWRTYQWCEKHPGWSIPARYGTTPQGEFTKVRSSDRYAVRIHFLDRTEFMSRAIGRFVGEEAFAGVSIRGSADREYINHVTANRRVVKKGKYGNQKVSWQKDDDAKDDFLHAAVYAEYAAILAGLERTREEADANKKMATRKARREQKRREEEGEDDYFVRLRRARRRGDDSWLGSVQGKE